MKAHHTNFTSNWLKFDRFTVGPYSMLVEFELGDLERWDSLSAALKGMMTLAEVTANRQDRKGLPEDFAEFNAPEVLLSIGRSEP